jgi:hypothetical protein
MKTFDLMDWLLGSVCIFHVLFLQLLPKFYPLSTMYNDLIRKTNLMPPLSPPYHPHSHNLVQLPCYRFLLL